MGDVTPQLLRTEHGIMSWEELDETLQEQSREIQSLRSKLDGILSLIGNVDHSRGGGENTARMYGQMLNDIRDLLSPPSNT
jgi:hypothetical protein